MGKLLEILIADDDSDNHELFEAALRGIDLDRVKASSITSLKSVYDGMGALEYLEKRRHLADKLPDLIVLDLNMPFADGCTVLEKIVADEVYKQIPTFILTVSTNDEDRKKCLGLGAAGYFCKPATMEQLRQVVMQIVTCNVNYN